MPVTYRGYKISALSLRIFICWMLCMGHQTAYAEDGATNQATSKEDNSWKAYPLSVQLNSHNGILFPICLLDVAKGDTPSKEILVALGGRIDLGLLYANRWIWEHFDCYPKVGIQLKYNYITNNYILEKGHITGGVFYIEPNFDHLDGWEILPRAGVGIAYASIPGGFSSLTPAKIIVQNQDGEDEEEEGQPYSAEHLDAFREDVDLNIILDMMVKYRLTPNWHLYFTIGLDYLPGLFTQLSDPDNALARGKKALEIMTASLGCSYTVNPSKYAPPRTHRQTRNTIRVAFFNSFRRPLPHPEDKIPMDDKYRYLGGLHMQWSYQIASNHAIVFGSEWSKDLALKRELRDKVIRDHLQVGFMIGHEFLWGDLIFGQYVGAYVYSKANFHKRYIHNDIFYLRLGLDYSLTDHLYIGTNLKVSIFPDTRESKPLGSVYTRLDYLDFRVGWSF